MKRIKTLSLLVALGGAIACLTGCNTQSTQLKITFWHNSKKDDVINEAVKTFQEVVPDVKVEAVRLSDSYNQMKERVIKGLGADAYPDIFYGYPDSVAEILQNNKDAVADLTPYVTDDFSKDIVDDYLREAKDYHIKGIDDGCIFSMPFSKSTEAMFYNKNILGIDFTKVKEGGVTLKEKYGVSVDSITENYINNLTWEELFDHLSPALVAYNNQLPEGKKIYKPESSDFHGVVGYDSDENFFITLCQQYGYGFTSYNKETKEASIDFNNNQIKNLLVKYATNYVGNDILFTKGTAKNNNVSKAFVKAACLFSIGSTGGASYQVSKDFDVGVAKVPHAEGKHPYVINQGPSIAILQHKGDKNCSKRVETAWKFYKHYVDNYSIAWTINTGYFPVTKSGFQTDDFKDACNEDGKLERTLEMTNARVFQYSQTLELEKAYFSSPVFKGSAEARNQVGGLCTKVLSAGTEASKLDIDSLFNEAVNHVKEKM